MLTQIEIRTLSGEVRYGAGNHNVLPELCGTVLLPQNQAMLVRVCEHRKAVMNGTYKPKQLSEETLRRFNLRPEYAKQGAVADDAFIRTLRADANAVIARESERAACARRAQAILDEHEADQAAIRRNRLLFSAL